MPEMYQRGCQAPGPKGICGRPTNSRYCTEHADFDKPARNEADRKRYREDEFRRFETSSVWRNFALTHKMWNPQCQCIEDGQRCRFPPYATHHIVDPRAGYQGDADYGWNLRLSASNTASVCRKHHQGGQQGETQGYIYAPTREHTVDHRWIEHDLTERVAIALAINAARPANKPTAAVRYGTDAPLSTKPIEWNPDWDKLFPGQQNPR